MQMPLIDLLVLLDYVHGPVSGSKAHILEPLATCGAIRLGVLWLRHCGAQSSL